MIARWVGTFHNAGRLREHLPSRRLGRRLRAGSDAAATKGYRQLLEQFICERGIASVVDLGCGDGRLARLIDWGECSYLGLDIVRPVIERNQRLYGMERIQFAHADIREYPLPAADLFILKDVLQHWSNSEVERFFPKLNGARFTLITNTTNNIQENADTATGMYRVLDVSKPPFSWPVKLLAQYHAAPPIDRRTDLKSVHLYERQR